MAWQDVTPVIGSTANAKGRVRYRVTKKMGCTVTIPPDVVDALSWKAGTRLKLAVGGGDLLGKLKLSEEPEALPQLKGSRGGVFVLRLGRWPQLPDREVERLAVEHQVEGRALILTLPSHALNVAPQRPGVSIAPPPRMVDVTERVAGRNGSRTEPVAGTRR